MVESQFLAANDSINADMKSKLDAFKSEKEALEKRVDEEKAAQDELKVGMERLQAELKTKQEEFETKRKSFSEDLEKRQILEQQLEQERQEFEKKHNELESDMNAKIKQSEDNLQKLLQEKEDSVATLQQEKTKMEEKMELERAKFEDQLQKLQNLNKENDQNHQEMLQKINAEFNDRLKENQDQFAAAVIVEKQEREEERQKYNEELKEREQKIAELHEKVKQIENDQEQKLKRDVQLSVLKKSNDELKCTICDELFLVPVTLNCGHVFCEFCINQWKDKVKKKSDFTCPNCRIAITSQSRSLQLENLISALYRDIDESIAKDREALIAERKAENERAQNDKKGGKSKKPVNTGNIRDWARNRQNPGPPPGPHPGTRPGTRPVPAQSTPNRTPTSQSLPGGVQIIPINPPGVNPPASAVPLTNGVATEVVVETSQNSANQTPHIMQNPNDPT